MTMQTNPTARRPRKMAREPQPASPDTAGANAEPAMRRPQTKASIVEDLLRKADGASLDDLCRATGWLPHTCRAFLTGLRKKGRDLERGRREDGTTIYRLVSMKDAA